MNLLPHARRPLLLALVLAASGCGDPPTPPADNTNDPARRPNPKDTILLAPVTAPSKKR